MQNYYIRIEDMPSLVSHQLSIIKYVVLKKIIFSFSVLTVSFGLGLGLEPLWTRTWLGLEPLWTWTWLGLEPLWTWTCLGLDKGGLDYSPTCEYNMVVGCILEIHQIYVELISIYKFFLCYCLRECVAPKEILHGVGSKTRFVSSQLGQIRCVLFFLKLPVVV